jgi:hypothetical protein
MNQLWIAAVCLGVLVVWLLVRRNKKLDEIRGISNLMLEQAEKLLAQTHDRAVGEWWEKRACNLQYVLSGGHDGRSEFIELKMDGDQWCATVLEDFVDLQSSPAGFGQTRKDAVEGLLVKVCEDLKP